MHFRPLKLTEEELPNPSSYIQVPRRDKVLLVAKERLRLTDEVRAVGGTLGLTLQEQESSLVNNIGDLNWKDAIRLNLALGGCTLGWGNYVHFVLQLLNGHVYDGTGTELQDRERESVLEDVFSICSGEFVDTKFEVRHGLRYLLSHHILKEEGNVHSDLVALTDTRVAAHTDNFAYSPIRYLNSQGLVDQVRDLRCSRHELVYVVPPKVNGPSIAVVSSNKYSLVVNCSKAIENSADPRIGVRHVRIFHRK